MAERFKVTKSGDGGKVRTYGPSRSKEALDQAQDADDSDPESGLLRARRSSQDGNIGTCRVATRGDAVSSCSRPSHWPLVTQHGPGDRTPGRQDAGSPAARQG